jgi:peroxiredoxin Q/BCP
MAQLRQDYDKFIAQDTEVIVVGPENASSFSLYWKSHKLPFVGLPDPKHIVLKLYGQEVSLFKLGRQPAQVSVDKMGQARFVHYGHNMSDIPPNAEILERLQTLNCEYSDHIQSMARDALEEA